MKNVTVLTTSRSDYDLLSGVISEFKNNKNFKTSLIVSGSHFDKRFGKTYKRILEDKFKIDHKIELSYKNLSKINLVKNLSKLSEGLALFFKNNKQDLFIILGDRHETLCAAFIANFNNIPIAHIGGGEITEGSQDDCYRHAISKLSNIHFVSHPSHKKRLIQLGEKKETIFITGNLGVENLKKDNLLTKNEIEKDIGIKLKDKNFFVTYHPETINLNQNLKFIKILLESFLAFDNYNVFITSPNADSGSHEVTQFINKFIKINKNFYFFKNLGRVKYFSLIRVCNLYIGNSSSGIVEVPSLKKITLNLGNRQKGRLKAKSVIDIDFNKKRIISTIKKYLNTKNNNFYFSNPYERANPSKTIVSKISKYNLEKIFPKEFINLKKY